MALKDSFINLNKALRTTLQNVPAVVDTLIRGFDEIGDAAEAEGTYSTTERVVGKWIDGSDIYEKTVSVGTMPSNTTAEIAHGISNIDHLISAEGIAYSSYTSIPLPNVGVTVSVNKVNIVIVTSTTAYGSYTGYVTVRYIKTAANRAPKNDTKNGGDDEPVVKGVDDVDYPPTEELKK